MNFKDKLKIAFKGSIKTKSSIITIFITSIIISMILIVCSFGSSLNSYWKETVKKTMDYRTLLVAYNPQSMNEKEAMKKLGEYDHVEVIAPYSAYLITMISNDYKANDKENGFFMIGSVDHPLEIEKGSDLSSYDDNDKVMICAKQFSPYFEKEGEQYNNKNVVDISSKIGDELSVSFMESTQVEKFKLVGVYDVRKTNTLGNVCYTTWENVTYLNLKYQQEVYAQKKDEYLPVVVVIDEVDAVDNIVKKITSDGFNTSGPVLKVNTKVGDQALNVFTMGTMLLGIIIVVLSTILSLKDINKKQTKYGLMKAYGYTNNDIKVIKVIEELYKYIIAFIIALPMSIMLLNIFQNVYVNNQIMINGLKIIITTQSIFLALIISLSVPLLSSLIALNKIGTINPIKFIKG